MVGAERLALVEDAHQHRHDPVVPLGDQRLDDGAALLAGGGAEHGVDAPGGRRIVDAGERPDGGPCHPRIVATQERLQQRHRLGRPEPPEQLAGIDARTYQCGLSMSGASRITAARAVRLR